MIKQDAGITVCPGQTRPIAFKLTFHQADFSSISINIIYERTRTGTHSALSVSQKLTKRSIYEPHKITYLFSNSIASYAILRPPSKNATCHLEVQAALPVLFGLHGAGLEADSEPVAHALDPIPDLCGWVLFPTGVTPWSGDDWRKLKESSHPVTVTNPG